MLTIEEKTFRGGKSLFVACFSKAIFLVRFRLLLWLGVVLLGLNPTSATAVTADLIPSATTTNFPRVGIPFVLELHLYNGGPDTVNNAVLTDVLPPGWSLISCDFLPYLISGNTYGTPFDPNAVPPSWTNYGNTVVCNGGTIYGFYYRTIYLTVVANQPGSFSNPVSVSAAGVNDPLYNNQIYQAVTVHTNGLFVFGGQSVSEASGSNVVFTVVLSPSNSVPVTVDYATGGGTATAGQDYQFTAGTLIFPPGVTNLTVSIPALDDALAETAGQSFTLLLTNAVNAELSGQAQFNYVLDDEAAPLLWLSNAPPIVEGNGETNLLFPVALSRPCDVPLLMTYVAAGGLTNSGILTIPAGVTNYDLAIPIVGDLLIQSNRTVTVTLSDLTPLGLLTNATAEGLIIEDDGLPGNFHHMEISTVPSPQIVGRPFTVTLTAKDAFNQPATNYTVDNVSVSAYRGSLFEQTVYVTNFVNGMAEAVFTFSNTSTNSNIVAWKPVGYGYAPVSTPQFKVIAPPPLALTLPGFGVEGDGVLSNAGRVTIPAVDVQDVVVQLSTGDLQEILVPPSVLIPVGQTSAVFDVTIVDDTRLDGLHSTPVTASATGYVAMSKQISVQDNESAVLSLTLPAQLSEAKGANTGTATVSASAAPVFPILVRLLSSDATELTLPASVFIQAGQTSATFTVTAPDDSYIDGPQAVTVSANVTNWTSASATITVLDNDTNVTLTLSFGNTAPIEGLGTITNALQVKLGGITSNDVVVQLLSSDASEVIVPPEVLIRAGQQSVTTNIALPDDNEMDGLQTVVLTGMVPGFVTGARNLNVPDNDIHHFTIAALPAYLTSGVPFRVTIMAKDVNDVSMENIRENLSLSAICNGSPILTVPNTLAGGGVVRGAWSGNVTINQWGTNMQLRVASTNSNAVALSNPFTVPIPSWAENLRISRVQLDGDDVLLFFPSSTGRVYQVEMSTNNGLSAWNGVGPAQAGTGAELSLRDVNAAGQKTRFYRLATPLQ